MLRTLIVGDIHGHFKKFKRALSACRFNPKSDMLIVLGDIVDGGRETSSCIEFLVNIPNKIIILGNHDQWVINWFKTGAELPVWIHQGGYATMESYFFDYMLVPQSHKDLLESAIPYYIDSANRIYVHGGFKPRTPIGAQPIETLVWDRNLIAYAKRFNIKPYSHVFVGHTTTQIFKTSKPLTFHNLTMLDTGAGWYGPLTIMDAVTRDYWQSK